MSKAFPLSVLALFLFVQNVFSQTQPLSILPKNAQKLLNDFAFVESNVLLSGIYTGRDSLQFQLPTPKTIPSFYINRFEVTVEEFRAFYEATGKATDKPDSSIWISEFPASYNRPIAEHYFSSPKYINHPVVSVNWDQAVRYCNWKAERINALLKNTDYVVEIRLPTEAEWELAALGNSKKTAGNLLVAPPRRLFPWEGGFMKSDGNSFQFQCNFGPIKAPQDNFMLVNYAEDGYLYTAPVRSYPPNEYGLYQMAGNAAEWTSDHYSIDSAALNKVLELHPELSANPRYHPTFPLHQYDGYMIVKGGSWVDEPFYTQCSVRKIHRPDLGSATIGFRPVCVVRKRG